MSLPEPESIFKHSLIVSVWEVTPLLPLLSGVQIKVGQEAPAGAATEQSSKRGPKLCNFDISFLIRASSSGCFGLDRHMTCCDSLEAEFHRAFALAPSSGLNLNVVYDLCRANDSPHQIGCWRARKHLAWRSIFSSVSRKTIIICSFCA